MNCKDAMNQNVTKGSFAIELHRTRKLFIKMMISIPVFVIAMFMLTKLTLNLKSFLSIVIPAFVLVAVVDVLFLLFSYFQWRQQAREITMNDFGITVNNLVILKKQLVKVEKIYSPTKFLMRYEETIAIHWLDNGTNRKTRIPIRFYTNNQAIIEYFIVVNKDDFHRKLSLLEIDPMANSKYVFGDDRALFIHNYFIDPFLSRDINSQLIKIDKQTYFYLPVIKDGVVTVRINDYMEKGIYVTIDDGENSPVTFLFDSKKYFSQVLAYLNQLNDNGMTVKFDIETLVTML